MYHVFLSYACLCFTCIQFLLFINVDCNFEWCMYQSVIFSLIFNIFNEIKKRQHYIRPDIVMLIIFLKIQVFVFVYIVTLPWVYSAKCAAAPTLRHPHYKKGVQCIWAFTSFDHYCPGINDEPFKQFITSKHRYMHSLCSQCLRTLCVEVEIMLSFRPIIPPESIVLNEILLRADLGIRLHPSRYIVANNGVGLGDSNYVSSFILSGHFVERFYWAT